MDDVRHYRRAMENVWAMNWCPTVEPWHRRPGVSSSPRLPSWHGSWLPTVLAWQRENVLSPTKATYLYTRSTECQQHGAWTPWTNVGWYDTLDLAWSGTFWYLDVWASFCLFRLVHVKKIRVAGAAKGESGVQRFTWNTYMCNWCNHVSKIGELLGEFLGNFWFYESFCPSVRQPKWSDIRQLKIIIFN